MAAKTQKRRTAMRYQKTHERRAVILMVVLSLLTLFALVGVTFVLYADAEATAARVFREAETIRVADVDPQQALAFFLGQLIYDVPDTAAGVGSGLRGHSLARTMYGYNYTVPPIPSLNTVPFNGIGRLHYGSPLTYPVTPLTNVPPNWGTQLDDYALVNYTWFSGDNFIRDPERYGSHSAPLAPGQANPNPYVGGNAPYTYPDLNNFFLAAMKADGTVLTPSYHRPWLFQVVGGKYYAFNDMTNPNWTNPQGKYLTLRPRPAEHPQFPLPGDATGDVKNLPWAPGGNDSIWIDLGAPVMTAPDGTPYKMLFAPLIIDLDNRINLNTAGNILGYIANMAAPTSWQQASNTHVSNQGWGPWEVNLSKVLWADQATWAPSPPGAPATPPEWMRLLTGMSYVVPTPPNTLPVVQPGVLPIPSLLPPTPGAPLSAWLLPGVPGRYLETLPGGTPVWTPNASASTIPYYPNAISLNATYQHIYAQSDENGLNEFNNGATPSSRPAPPGSSGGVATSPFPTFGAGYSNGNSTEATNHPLLFNVFQTPLTSSGGTRAFRASDMEALLRPNASINGPVDANTSAVMSDLLRLCPLNFAPYSLSNWSTLTAAQKTAAMRFRNLVTTQSTDIGSPGVTPYWYEMNGTTWPSPYPSNQGLSNYSTQCAQLAPVSGAVPFPQIAATYPPPPLPGVGNNPTGTPPNYSEFGLDWRAVSANNATYLPFSSANPVYFQNPAYFQIVNQPPPSPPPSFAYVYWSWGNPQLNQWNFLSIPPPPPPPPPAPRTQYVTPGARIRLNRPLPPYPHMGSNLTPPYNYATPPSSYGTAYNLSNATIAYQYQAAVNARQALANDIYRRLLAISGLQPIPPSPPGMTPPPLGTSSNPNNLQLAPRRWLAQLAVNIVDFIDEDDIMTPFNFYTVADGLPAASIGATTGGDDTTPNTNNQFGTNQTGANPLYWVFGTEMPKVVLNEVLAEAQNPDPTQQAGSNESVKVWIELYNTMPKTGGTNTQPQDVNRVPLYMTNPAGPGYSPYRITIAQNLQTPPLPTGETSSSTTNINILPDAGANVLGQAYFGNANSPNTFSPLPQSTTDSDFLAGSPNPSTIPLINGGTQGAGVGTSNAGVDAGGYFLIGPPSPGSPYEDPFVLANNGNGVPSGTPTLRTSNMQYTPTTTSWPANGNSDERTNGLTVMLRRLANPYLPFNPNPSIPDPNNPSNSIPNPVYNPYVTVDYISSVPIQGTNSASLFSLGKRQPYAGLLQPSNPPAVVKYTAGSGSILIDPNSPVIGQATNANPPAPPGASVTNQVTNTFGYSNWPLPQSGHYDWLVHLDRPPISPMELLHVSAWPPHMLTQKFIVENPYLITYAGTPPGVGSAPGSDNLGTGGNLANSLNMFGHYVPWFDYPPNVSTSMAAPWWFDPNPSSAVPAGSTLTAGQTHRLYRLFEFLECGDRAYGVNGLGRIPGKVNINTIWDPEILQALIDANATTMGINTMPSQYPPNGTDQIVQIFANMITSRSPSAGYNLATGNLTLNPQTNTYSFAVGPVNMGTTTGGVGDDHPFLPLSSGLITAAAGTQFPNGIGILRDTLLRTNPTAAANNTTLLFQNPTDNQAVHPYLQTQLLTKLFNNVTTRSNVFAVFLTVGFFQVTNPNSTPPQLGPELGASEGKQIRHRMFAIVDRTNLTTFTTNSATAISGVTPINPTGTQTIQLPVLPPPLTITGTGTGATAQLFVPNPNTGVPGLIQAGTQLVIDPGNVNEETVTVSAVTPPAGTTPATITANFTLPHAAGATIVQRGNPGPWLTPYDPRLDSNVVLYFSIID
jgi:hypothetical protein